MMGISPQTSVLRWYTHRLMYIDAFVCVFVNAMSFKSACSHLKTYVRACARTHFAIYLNGLCARSHQTDECVTKGVRTRHHSHERTHM